MLTSLHTSGRYLLLTGIMLMLTTNPSYAVDTDGDGASDASETTHSTDPLDDTDYPHVFADITVNSDPAYAASLALFDARIATGCNDNATPDFCPHMMVPRASAALWLIRAAEGGGYTPSAFVQEYDDVTSSSDFAAAFVSDMHPDNHGFSRGCDFCNSRYCPRDHVSRVQAAQMILRAKGYTSEPGCTGGVWNDVTAATTGCGWMEEMGNQGWAEGCGSGNFCPEELLTFTGFAKLVANAFNLLP